MMHSSTNPNAGDGVCYSLFAAFGATPSAKCCAGTVTSIAISIALFVIMCMGAAGSLSSSTLGWSAIGLGSAGFLSGAITGDCDKKALKIRRVALIISVLSTAITIATGSLALSGILSASQAGGILIGTTIGGGILGSIISRCDPQLKKIQEEEARKLRERLSDDA